MLNTIQSALFNKNSLKSQHFQNLNFDDDSDDISDSNTTDIEPNPIISNGYRTPNFPESYEFKNNNSKIKNDKKSSQEKSHDKKNAPKNNEKIDPKRTLSQHVKKAEVLLNENNTQELEKMIDKIDQRRLGRDPTHKARPESGTVQYPSTDLTDLVHNIHLENKNQIWNKNIKISTLHSLIPKGNLRDDEKNNILDPKMIEKMIPENMTPMVDMLSLTRQESAKNDPDLLPHNYSIDEYGRVNINKIDSNGNEQNLNQNEISKLDMSTSTFDYLLTKAKEPTPPVVRGNVDKPVLIKRDHNVLFKLDAEKEKEKEIEDNKQNGEKGEGKFGNIFNQNNNNENSSEEKSGLLTSKTTHKSSFSLKSTKPTHSNVNVQYSSTIQRDLINHYNDMIDLDHQRQDY
jgi:hypothetical protein